MTHAHHHHEDDDGLDLAGLLAAAALPYKGTELPSDAFGFKASQQGFDFTVTIVDQVGGTAASILALFETITEKALEAWGHFLNGFGNANLDVQVNVGGTNAVASAGPGSIFFDGDFVDTNGSGSFDAGDIGTVIAGSLLELQTGTDFNGSTPDIIVNVNEQLINGGQFFFDPELDDPVPANQIDFYSVILHELGHGLGFLGLANSVPVASSLPSGNFLGFGTITAATQYDLFIDDSSGVPLFTGPNSVALYGGGVPLEYTTGSGGSDISHFLGNTGNSFGTPVDLRLSLMNPFVIQGDRADIGATELALFADIGHSVTNINQAPFINILDGLPASAVPTVSVSGLAGTGSGSLDIGIVLSSAPPFSTVSSSVGLDLATSAGTNLDGRVLFQPGDTSETVTLSFTEVFGVSSVAQGQSVTGSIDVTLFNPAQAVLAGAQIGAQQTDTVTIDLILQGGPGGSQTVSVAPSGSVLLGGDPITGLTGGAPSGNRLDDIYVSTGLFADEGFAFETDPIPVSGSDWADARGLDLRSIDGRAEPDGFEALGAERAPLIWANDLSLTNDLEFGSTGDFL
ncbi:hypothetical protein CCR80_01110 [Rhodothalassium salexigens]|uniref:hypothetical protein n=1 Tax=Rhodothalassium salexigens TaxID=1086 RepID=UPI001914D9AB|nr:hypothetical protein [Rhodothalassium salexigens]MBK5919636.1 hypothetical protein [Rhodothalassium salexigens]